MDGRETKAETAQTAGYRRAHGGDAVPALPLAADWRESGIFAACTAANRFRRGPP